LRALLLAAGMGTRLRPLTDRIPKCLVTIGGIPLLDFWLDMLVGAGIERILINTHWLSERVENHVAACRYRRQIDLVHENRLLGTAGTILANRAYFGGDPLLVAHADNLTDFDVVRFLQAHERRPAGCAFTMLAFHTDSPRSCGILELDSSNIVQGFHEKVADPPGTLANAAAYIIGPEVVSHIVGLGRPVVDFSTEVIPCFVGRIFAVETTGYHRDIGTPEALSQAEADIATGKFIPSQRGISSKVEQGQTH
jgi:mannose-1-phosphate guanylyltransferase